MSVGLRWSASESTGVGNPISVLNVAAVCGVVGISGWEGDVPRKTAVVVFAVFAGVLGLLLGSVIAPGVP